MLISTGAAAVAAGAVRCDSAGAVSTATAGSTAAVGMEEGVGLREGDVHMLLHHAVDGDCCLGKRFQVFGAVVPERTDNKETSISYITFFNTSLMQELGTENSAT